MPAVSVIIPVYNTAPWLEECLNSVMNQTFRDMEIICVNDASTDASSDILAAFAQKDGRIRIITLEKNSGQASARNIGLEKAAGEYIYFLDSDDSITLDALERLYRLSMAQKLDIVYFDANPLFDSKELEKSFSTYLFYRDRANYLDKVYSGPELMESFLANDEWSCSVPRQFYSAAFLKNNNLKFFDGILHEDELFSFQCVLLAQKTSFIPDRLFNRRFRAGSTMTGEKSARHFCGLFTAAYYMNLYARQNGFYNSLVRSFLAKMNNRAIALFETYRTEICSEIIKLQNKELLNAYYLFEALQDSYCAYGEVSDGLVNLLQQHERVFIYGAGVIAKSVCRGLAKREIPVSGFVVTSCEGNPPVLEGRHVYDVNAFAALQNLNKTIVVVAVKSGREEIRTLLEQIPVDSAYYNS